MVVKGIEARGLSVEVLGLPSGDIDAGVRKWAAADNSAADNVVTLTFRSWATPNTDVVVQQPRSPTNERCRNPRGGGDER